MSKEDKTTRPPVLNAGVVLDNPYGFLCRNRHTAKSTPGDQIFHRPHKPRHRTGPKAHPYLFSRGQYALPEQADTLGLPSQIQERIRDLEKR